MLLDQRDVTGRPTKESATAMSIRHRFSKRVAAAASIPIAMVASGAMVWHASYSAFSATTSNPTSNWAAGSVALTDDDSNTAMFTLGTAGNLKPGSTGSKCIVVTSNGTLPSAVKLYGTSPATTNQLSTYLTITVDEGTGGSFSGGCGAFTSTQQIYNGTLANFGATKTNYSSGVGSWQPTGTAGETKVYKFTYTLSSTTPDTSQGGTASIGFTWEAQNT
jgi:hypothetical protein